MDGIERIPDVPVSPGVVPFRMTGHQFPKHKVLFRQLIPGNAYSFPNESLSSQELVRTLSNIPNKCLLVFSALIRFIFLSTRGSLPGGKETEA
jgi:hypothetical protein